MQILRRTPEFKPEEVAVAEEVIDSYLCDAGSGYFILIAELEAKVAGYVCYGKTPLTEGTWDIYWMATAPEKQGRGIGGALLDAAEEHIGKEGGRMAMIETSSKPDYEKTRRFHINHGYEIIGRVADFYMPGDDKLLMQKRFAK
jgi:ribosomal protein S18 acetylase RimI-like enzyme